MHPGRTRTHAPWISPYMTSLEEPGVLKIGILLCFSLTKVSLRGISPRRSPLIKVKSRRVAFFQPVYRPRKGLS